MKPSKTHLTATIGQENQKKSLFCQGFTLIELLVSTYCLYPRKLV